MQPHGAVRVLSNRVRRIVAPNPGPMTGPRHQYLCYWRDRSGGCSIPVPAIAEHVDAILECVGDRLRLRRVYSHPPRSFSRCGCARGQHGGVVGGANDRG
jgi:hypothetical protein